MPDVFGYAKTGGEVGSLASPAYVTIDIDGLELKLAQSATLTYRRDVKAVTVIGSDSVYMQPGVPSGTLLVTRIIGPECDALEPYSTGDPCKPIDITIGDIGGECSGCIGYIFCGNCLLQEVGLQINAQDVSITDNATWMVGSVER